MERSLRVADDSGLPEGVPPFDGDPLLDGERLLGGVMAVSCGCVVEAEAEALGLLGATGAGAHAASPATKAVQARAATPARKHPTEREGTASCTSSCAVRLNMAVVKIRTNFAASSLFCHTNSRLGARLRTTRPQS